jgi:prenyltransferase beta subunit
MINDALSVENHSKIARFLARQQCADGGLRAHANLNHGDLLSTFTGLLTLVGLEGFDLIDLRGLARFLQRTGRLAGGFISCLADISADVEYGHYGLGTLSILRSLE